MLDIDTFTKGLRLDIFFSLKRFKSENAMFTGLFTECHRHIR